MGTCFCYFVKESKSSALCYYFCNISCTRLYAVVHTIAVVLQIQALIMFRDNRGVNIDLVLG